MENLGFGLQITVVGMGLVFSLLIMLWGLLVLIGRFDQLGQATPVTTTEEPALPAPPLEPTEAPIVATTTSPNEKMAAIMLAVLAHQAAQRRMAAPETRTYQPGSLLYASRWVMSGRSRQTRSWNRRG